ncbi:hypothetical protein [Ramlibacter montanisoli]|uniref:Uncharacterized protein n=1 Tax=Ramlibacter montanisoli TaxID=2732512 RepID=A0A849K4P3_9BURK|nr:hypothetical protein [Ramlibacter montanisoli]NNU42590.1 hypothetical protein [Ramlibacter montanisoli]
MLEQAADALGAWLSPRVVGMAQFAANDIVIALSQATRFLRDRMLQGAFGVHDLWGLVGAVGSVHGQGVQQSRDRVELGRHGAEVLQWLARGITQAYAFDPASAEGQRLLASAQGWRLAWSSLNRHDERRHALAA